MKRILRHISNSLQSNPLSLTESVKPCLYSVDLQVSLAAQTSLPQMSQHYPH